MIFLKHLNLLSFRAKSIFHSNTKRITNLPYLNSKTNEIKMYTSYLLNRKGEIFNIDYKKYDLLLIYSLGYNFKANKSSENKID